MKKRILNFVCILLIAFIINGANAQSVPQGFNYQAVARNASGALINNQSVNVRISIISGTATGIVQWQETHSTTTNEFGLFTLIIGQGISTGLGTSATFSAINWASANHYLKVEVDYTGGSNYVNMGTLQLWSVPYAMVAENALNSPVGPTGATGLLGPTGPTGPSGTNGLNGATGATGHIGPTGPIGPIGTSGPPGITGNNGPQGPQGLPGINGANGPTGPAGINGATGPTGIAGSNGVTGVQGAPGPAGINGATGPTGPAGIAGTNGITGAQGPTGATGAISVVPGPTGATGPTGFGMGPTGPTGADGTNGAPGPTGPAGANGAAGVQGPTGPAGANGAAGAQGPTGPAGANGTAGAQGPTGPAGSNGVAGAQGPTGPSGTDGTNGSNGVQGPTGPAGPVGCGSGNYVIKSDGTNALCSQIYDDGTYVGIGTAAPAAKLNVVQDADNLPVIYGKNINSTAGTTAFGVRGECGAIGLGSAGISGVSTNSGQNEIGTLGDYSLWGAAIFGMAWAGAYSDMPTSKDFGLFGTVNFPTGTGMYANNSSSGANAIYGVGNQVVTGTKSASVPTSKGNQLLYCTESPEIWFEDIGSAKLVNGEVTIYMDSLFLETVFIDSLHPYHVFITLEGDCNGVFVKEKGKNYFVIKEIQQGTSNAAFSYRIMAKRVNYQDHRFGCDWMQPFEDNRTKAKYVKPYTVDPLVTKKWVEELTKKKNDSIIKTK